MPQDLILLCRNLAEYWLGVIWLNESHGMSYHVLSCHMSSPCDYVIIDKKLAFARAMAWCRQTCGHYYILG